jgi:hypothetical protein
VQAAPLVGTWRLVSAVYRRADGSEAETGWGKSPLGVLRYDAGGNMAVQISRSDRARWQTEDRQRGTPDELAAAFNSYLGYFGRYSVDEAARTVTHTLLGCTFPNWVGTRQQRFFQVDATTLTLRTPAFPLGGETVVGTLSWERIAD